MASENVILLSIPYDIEECSVNDRAGGTLLTVAIDLTLVDSLFFLAVLAALYWSLREPSRVFAHRARIGGPYHRPYHRWHRGLSLAADAFSALYADAAVSDRPVVVATYAAVVSLLQAGGSAAFLFQGLAFVAFGLAMRGSQDFGEGLAWLSVVLGIIVVLSTFLFVAFPVAIIAFAVFALVLGWKVYSLLKAA